MATAQSLRTRHEAILAQYVDKLPFVRSVQQVGSREELDGMLREGLGGRELEREEGDLVKDFLDDPLTIFRFARRARFSHPATLLSLSHTLLYRLATPLQTIPQRAEEPLFFFHPLLKDRFGRPCAVLNLKHVSRDPVIVGGGEEGEEGGGLEGLKEFVRVGWEMGRRWLAESVAADQKDAGGEGGGGEGAQVQMVVMVDLQGAGMSNLEVELLPFFMDLLKNHFPGMVGAIFVLNYGWMYAGMWQLAKRVLPNTALERILFPTNAELLQFFDKDHLLVEHGGNVAYTYSSSNPLLKKYLSKPFPTTLASPRPLSLSLHHHHHHHSASAYPSPLPSPSMSGPPSRSTSYESISDVFHSVPNTPRTSMVGLSSIASGGSSYSGRGADGGGGVGMRRSTTGLSMTSLATTSLGLGMTSLIPATSSSSSTTPTSAMPPPMLSRRPSMRRIPSLIDIQMYLGETQAAIESDESQSDLDLDETDAEEVEDRWEMARGDPMILRSRGAEGERDDGGERSWTNSRAASRDASPARSHRGLGMSAGEGTFQSRAVKFSGKFQVSPYNTSNPYYGYPAFYPPSASTTSLSTLVPSVSTPSLPAFPRSNSTPFPHTVPKPHYHRRRKRDLFRTLTYLAVLRFLALHRHLHARFNALMRLVGGGGHVGSRGAKVLYALVWLILLRTPWITRGGEWAVGGVRGLIPVEAARSAWSDIAQGGRGITGGGQVAKGMRKRDFVRGLLGQAVTHAKS